MITTLKKYLSPLVVGAGFVASSVIPDSDAPKYLAEWLACAVFILIVTNEAIRFFKFVRGKAPEPPNEVLGVEKKHLSRRLYVVEGDVRKINKTLAEYKVELSRELRDQTQEIITSGMRRQNEIDGHFQEIAAALARLDERTKKA
jgi:hypothetical protein